MDPTTIINFAIKALEALPSIITMTEDAVKYIADTVTSLKAMQLEGRDPSDAEWNSLNETIQKLRDGRPALENVATN